MNTDLKDHVDMLAEERDAIFQATQIQDKDMEALDKTIEG